MFVAALSCQRTCSAGVVIYSVPEKPLGAFRGILKGMDTKDIIEDEKR
jgi:hypothetical protein